MNKIFLVILLISCGSARINHEHLEKNYKVVDSNLKYRPAWLESVNDWAKKNQESEYLDYEYYAYETTGQLDRDLACSLAKAKVKAPIVSQIKSEVSLKFSGFGSTRVVTSKASGKKILFDDVIKEKVSANVSGVEEIATYWEKRSFEDSQVYTCASLVRIKKSIMQAIVEDAVSEYKN